MDNPGNQLERAQEPVRVTHEQLATLHERVDRVLPPHVNLTLPGAQQMVSLELYNCEVERAALTLARITEEDGVTRSITLNAWNEQSGTKLFSIMSKASGEPEFLADGLPGLATDWEEFQQGVTIVEEQRNAMQSRVIGSTALGEQE